MADRLDEAMVWTILFSWIVVSWKNLSTAIEMTAAGIDVAKVSAGTQAEIDVCGREQHCDQRAENDRRGASAP